MDLTPFFLSKIAMMQAVMQKSFCVGFFPEIFNIILSIMSRESGIKFFLAFV